MIDSPMFQWVILPFLIFLARVLDVSIDTVRILLLSKGRRFLPPVLGFFQVLIWLLAFRQIILHLSNPLCYLAFAGGFAAGTFIGILIEEKLAIGTEVIRVITRKDATELIAVLKKNGFGVTYIDAKGTTGNVQIIFTIVSRKFIPQVLGLIKQFNPNAFYSIEGVRSVKEGGLPPLNKEPMKEHL